MATITIRINVEEALIEAGVPRSKWAEYVNEASLDKLKGEAKKAVSKGGEKGKG